MKRIGAKVISLFRRACVVWVVFACDRNLHSTYDETWDWLLVWMQCNLLCALTYSNRWELQQRLLCCLTDWFKYNLKRGTCKVSESASKELYELWAMLFSALHFFSGFVIKTQSIMKETLNPWWLSLLFIATVDEPVCCSQLSFGVLALFTLSVEWSSFYICCVSNF